MLAQIVHLVKENIEWVSTVLLSILGSLKAITFAKNDPACERVLDFVVGAAAGVLVGFYVSPEIGLVASLIISLITSAAAVLVLETLMGMIPNVVSEAIKARLGLRKD